LLLSSSTLGADVSVSNTLGDGAAITVSFLFGGEKIFVNSSPAIMPLAALYFGGIFFGGHISLKIGHIAPFLATIQALSKTQVFLLS
jgi:hypothetical protein